MNIWIIIPTYNEKENLPQLVSEIFKLHFPSEAPARSPRHLAEAGGDSSLAEGRSADLHVLVVDDNSPDGTGQVADQLTEKFSLEVLHRPDKLGLGSAYIAGFKKTLAAGADLIFEMDADFSHNPKDVPKLIEAVKQGADLAIGSRKVKGGKIVGWNPWRHFCSRGAMFLARFILNLKTNDVTAGFRCYRRHVLEAIELDKIESKGYAFQEEMLYHVEKMGFNVAEIPVTFLDRQKGQSKLNKKDVWEFFKVMLKLKFNKF